MALVPLATKGNYFHVYDFRVKAGRGDEFVELFNKFDYGDNNPFHRSRAQVKDGVLCRDVEYALIAALIAVAAISAFSLVGTSLSTTFSTIAGQL